MSNIHPVGTDDAEPVRNGSVREGSVGDILLPAHVAAAYHVDRNATRLPGTEGRTFRSGSVAPRREQDAPTVEWTARVLWSLPEKGFRIEQPLAAPDGSWVVDAWTAWTFLVGRPATPADAADVAEAVQALHHELASIPFARHLTDQAGFADRVAWGDDVLPSALPESIDDSIHDLVAIRRTVSGLRDQVIHGDLNFYNILIADGEAPGFIDFSPYWRPPEFAMAIAAYWLGPYLGDTSVLSHFDHVRAFDQMLIRVALRQLLRLIEPEGLEWADEFVRAATVVRQWAG